MDDHVRDLYMKFPAIWRTKLLSGEISFPPNLEIDYEPILAFRVVRREENEDREVTREDFVSHYELYKDSLKKPRGWPEDWECRIQYYAVSLFKEIEPLKSIFSLPKPKKRIIQGYVIKEGGPQETNREGHINWWLYEDADISHFNIIDQD